MADRTFARQIHLAMQAVAREAGSPAAYPRTKAGQLAALRQRLRAMDEDLWFFNDVQRTLVQQEITRLQDGQ